MKHKNVEKSPALSRREFLKTTGGAAALAGMGVTGLVLGPREVNATELPGEWDEEFDVVVIGSGFAGLAAAIEAKNVGSSVIVMEKMRVPGGNSIINGGVIAAANSPLQTNQGIKDSPELLYQDMLKAGLGLNHADLARMVAEKSNETVQWTISYLGVNYIGLVHLGGHSVPRSYCTYNRSGSAIVSQQLAKLKKLGVQVDTKRYLMKILRDKGGRVKGVQIRDGYRFPDEKSGTVKYIKAGKAVVMATGGFSNDVAFRTIQDPKLTADLDSTNQPGATAEALLEALNIGATLVQPSWIQLLPLTSPDEKGFGIAPYFLAGVVFQYGIMVNPATGKRFVSELADRKVRADAIIKTGHPCIGIAGAESAERAKWLTERLTRRGIVKEFDTLEELAAAYKIPFKPLKETIHNYNLYLADEEDKEFGRSLKRDAEPMTRSPFYTVRIWPKVHHTMGGIQINTKAQVIGLDRKPIEGLYAAGELAGGVHGAVRLGSCAVVDCLVFGRIAGRNAAAESPWS